MHQSSDYDTCNPSALPTTTSAVLSSGAGKRTFFHAPVGWRALHPLPSSQILAIKKRTLVVGTGYYNATDQKEGCDHGAEQVHTPSIISFPRCAKRNNSSSPIYLLPTAILGVIISKAAFLLSKRGIPPPTIHDFPPDPPSSPPLPGHQSI